LLDFIVNKAIILIKRNGNAYFDERTREPNADWYSGIKQR